MKILVTGGLGFIGSHTVVKLIESGYTVVILDNLSNTTIDVKGRIETILNQSIDFVKGDLRDTAFLERFFLEHQDISGVIHFAASKAVNESVEEPLMYYENNICSLINLLSCMKKYEVNNFIFSSSCTVYGQADEMPITETTPLKKAMSPYGNTKKIGEEIIEDVAKATEIKAVLLRYFNPIGAHETALIGELPIGVPQNLIPYITQTAAGMRQELKVYGDDYDTKDGAAIRDYIHVCDLAEAHVAALNRIVKNKNEENPEVYNLGTGVGNTVLEVIQSFEKVTNQKLPYSITGRREGDIAVAYANADKAFEKLNWKATHSLDESLKSAWEWQKYYQEQLAIEK